MAAGGGPEPVLGLRRMNRAGASDCEGRTFDVVIVGGGITGAATARDAALRGLDVLLVEADDYAAGTSSRSTKLLHGGLRYLKQYAFGLVREACRERELLGRLAPHLAHVRPFIYLLYPEDPEPRWMLHAGLTLYDLFSGNPSARRHTMLSARDVLAVEPHLRADGLRGGGRYEDFLTDDARLTIDTVKAASDAGALVANHTRVVDFLYGSGGRIVGVDVVDDLDGSTFTARGRVVASAAGIWTDAVRGRSRTAPGPILRPTKGTHLVLRRADLPLEHAVFFRHPRDGRTVWPIPSVDPELIYVGTTDTDYDGPPGDVAADEEDVDYLLEAANHIVPDANLGVEHLWGTWAGLRPLVAADPNASASEVSREHTITVDDDGLVAIAGGKLSTARAMAEELVDVVAEQLATHHGLPSPRPCSTTEQPLAGGDVAGWARAHRRMAATNLSSDVQARLLGRYGSETEGLLDLVATDASMGHEVAPGLTRAEIVYAARREQARTVTDVLARRTPTFFWTPDGGAAAADAVATELAHELSWSATTLAEQSGAFQRWRARNGYRTP